MFYVTSTACTFMCGIVESGLWLLFKMIIMWDMITAMKEFILKTYNQRKKLLSQYNCTIHIPKVPSRLGLVHIQSQTVHNKQTNKIKIKYNNY